MTITFNDYELFQLLQEHVQNTQPELLTDKKDRTLIIPDWIGSGYKRDIGLNHGLSLTLHQYHIEENFTFCSAAVQRNCFEFSFVLAAKTAGHKVSTNPSMVFMPQQVYFLKSALPADIYHAHAGQAFCAIDVHIKASSLMSMVEESNAKLPDDFQNMVSGNGIGHVLAPLQLTPHMQ